MCVRARRTCDLIFRQAEYERLRKQKEKAKQERDLRNAEQAGDAVEEAVKADDDAAHGDEAVHTLYCAQRLREKDAKPHPDPVVETQSLAGVSPPEITATHHLADIVKAAKISDLQLESVLCVSFFFFISHFSF